MPEGVIGRKKSGSAGKDFRLGLSERREAKTAHDNAEAASAEALTNAVRTAKARLAELVESASHGEAPSWFLAENGAVVVREVDALRWRIEHERLIATLLDMAGLLDWEYQGREDDQIFIDFCTLEAALEIRFLAAVSFS